MNPKQPVSFPGWKAALAASNLSPVVKSSHTRAILTLLHHCKKSHSPVTVVLIKQWLRGNEATEDGPAHVALRWFYRSAPKGESEDQSGAERNPCRTKATAAASSSPTGNAVATTQAAGKEARPEAALHLGGGEHGLGAAHAAAPRRSYSRSYNQRPPSRPMEPRPASQDLGGPDWEQALVATMRVRGLLSRTEDTYRAWAA